jgi:phosphoribosylanthranilate isomerase
MFVKICGMTSPEAIAAAVAAGADAVGFVFADSPREVTPAEARALSAGLPAGCLRVAVLHHPSAARLASVVDGFAPDWIQTDAEDFEAIELPSGCQALPVYRSGRLPAAGVGPARLLFEGAVSGSGQTADWDEARRLARGTELVLAGGLDPDNVAAAIEYVQPWGVDVSSGVERSRGIKDPARIARFVARVRAMENHR